MDSSAKKLSVFLLITLLSCLDTHARDSHFFNKIPSDTNHQQQNDNSYSLYGNYGHDSAQNPPSNVDLPKNYNPVAYVTQPDESTTFTEERSFTTKPKQQQQFNNNNYYYGPNRFRPQGMSDTRKYYYDDNGYLYGNNANEFNSMGGYQNQDEFQDEDNMP